jgi:beta-xylosidase
MAKLSIDFVAEKAPRPARQIHAPLPAWQADMGDGTYKNPVLHADYSDPDVIRVGEDYWMTSSSFNHVPGLPILHSRDLVNWTLVGHALQRQIPDGHYSVPQHGNGVWAPALRHHGGKFWIFYPDPDFGIHVITADDPRGEWSEPHVLKAGRGLIDPCPFWDDDGRAWMVHGWAKSRAGFCNRITLHEISPDGRSVLDEGMVVIDGDKMPGWKTIEGPKLYKRGGFYYIFTPAGGVAEGYQAVFRARDILGPYENRIVLEQGNTPVNGPHQGAWVDTPSGQHWFFHFQELPAHGRVVHLQPMRWRDDGWPVMGEDPSGHGTGYPVLRHDKPDCLAEKPAIPQTSDYFTNGLHGPQWQWQGNPRSDWLDATTTNQRGLKLRPVPTDSSLWKAPNLLMQKFPAPEFAVETRLTLQPSHETGLRAGLIVFGYSYAWIGLRERPDGTHELVQVICEKADLGGDESARGLVVWPSGEEVLLRVEISYDLSCRFFYRMADVSDRDFLPLGEALTARSSKWVGAKVGVFCACTPAPAQDGLPSQGYAVFKDFIVHR